MNDTQRTADHVTGPASLREYVGIIWVGNEPGVRFRILASSGEEAEERLVSEYGEGHAYTLRNEDDATKPR